MACELADPVFVYPKPRGNILFADEISCLDGSPYCMLCDNDGVASGKHPQRFEMQSCAAEPVTQELMPMTEAARTVDFDTRVR